MKSNTLLLEKLLALSSNETNSNKRQILDHFYKALQKLPQNEKKKFFYSPPQSFSSGFDLDLAIAKQYFQYFPLGFDIKNKYKKNNEISSQLRTLGNYSYRKKRYLKAVESFTLAIIFAEVEAGVILAEAYANRSVALICLGLTDEALEDLNLALSLLNGELCSNKNPLQDYLNGVKGTLEKKIHDRMENLPSEKKLKSEISKRTAFYEEMFTLKSSNRLAPALEDSVDFKWNSSRGRHLVANVDIPVGTTVLVEQSFVSILKGYVKWEMNHCHHCLKRNFHCIPCSSCIFTVYCNDKCRTDSQKYHQYECPCLPELQCMVNGEKGKLDCFLLAFKLVCIMGPQNLFSIFTERKEKNANSRTPRNYNLRILNGKNINHKPGTPVSSPHSPNCDSKCKMRTSRNWNENNDKNISGCDPITGIYSSDSYNAVFNLMTTDPKNGAEYWQTILLSLTLSYTLRTNSTFFDFIKNDEEKSEFQDFVTEFIHHHYYTFGKNVFSPLEYFGRKNLSLRSCMTPTSKSSFQNGPLRDDNDNDYAYVICPTASLINHSCDPNVTPFFGKRFGTIAIVAIKPLKEGEELLMSYGPYYGNYLEADMSSKERRIALQRIYDFKCNCIACYNEFANITELNETEPVFCCSVCARKFSHENKATREFAKCELSSSTNPKFKCKLCKAEYFKRSIQQQYDSHCKKLESCKELISSNQPLKAIQDIKSVLTFLSDNVCPPNFDQVNAFNVFQETVELINSFAESEM